MKAGNEGILPYTCPKGLVETFTSMKLNAFRFPVTNILQTITIISNIIISIPNAIFSIRCKKKKMIQMNDQ